MILASLHPHAIVAAQGGEQSTPTFAAGGTRPATGIRDSQILVNINIIEGEVASPQKAEEIIAKETFEAKLCTLLLFALLYPLSSTLLVLEGALKSSQSLLFSRLNNPKYLNLSAQERFSSPVIIFENLL
ncbi:hypothetical protein HGM15179_008628 [Zosterops borbonicus]|uniref:Uncharacterized protein n=1 Tax=Zosterops borbonicus TaxID=364589 RepID=A0A8K1GHS9_9PASS|nr:hypothetical protein HGM15179_008628 [Zosterops borbonicus]